jgi:hypothetical protein
MPQLLQGDVLIHIVLKTHSRDLGHEDYEHLVRHVAGGELLPWLPAERLVPEAAPVAFEGAVVELGPRSFGIDTKRPQNVCQELRRARG